MVLMSHIINCKNQLKLLCSTEAETAAAAAAAPPTKQFNIIFAQPLHQKQQQHAQLNSCAGQFVRNT